VYGYLAMVKVIENKDMMVLLGFLFDFFFLFDTPIKYSFSYT